MDRHRVLMKLPLCFLLIVVVQFPLISQSQVMETTTNGNEYLIYTPPGYPSGSDYPLLIYLHGAVSIGAVGQDASIVDDKAGPPKMIRRGLWDTSLPFIVLSPHLPRDPNVPNVVNQTWDHSLITDVLDYVEANYPIDSDRVYMSGISLGAKGVWAYTSEFPEKIAAILPFSGGADPTLVCNMYDVPVWAFHGNLDGLILMSGTKDGVVYGSEHLINTLNNCSSTPPIAPKMTILESKTHTGWEECYDLSSGFDIYNWLLAMEKNSTANISPFVTLGPDMTIAQTGQTLTINSEAFDPDGSISTLAWTKESGPSVTLGATDGAELEISNIQLGTYIFRLTATDNDAASTFDEISIDVTSDLSGPTIDNLVLFKILDGDTIDVGSVSNGQVINYNSLGTTDVYIRAEVSNFGSQGSVRFSLNQNRNFSTSNDTEESYTISGFENQNPFGRIFKRFEPTVGENNITAIPFSSRNGGGTAGVGQMAQVEFSNSTLPVTFRSTRARVVQESVRIDWSTASEINTSHFEIMKANSSMEFISLGEITATGSESRGAQYQFIDPAPSSGKNYYMIRAVDFDGSLTLSEIMKVTFKKNSLRAYPNPSDGNVNIEFDLGKNRGAFLEIYHVSGKKMLSRNYDQDGVISEKLSAGTLPRGSYVIRLRESDNFSTLQFIIN